MIEKTKKILNENNDYSKAQIHWNPDGLVLKREFKSDNISVLHIDVEKGIKIGLKVWSDHPDVGVELSHTYGRSFEISWWDQRLDRAVGDYDLGHLVIQCDAGEFVLPLQEKVFIHGQLPDKTLLDIDSFLTLVKSDYRKAFRYFVSSEGSKMIKSHLPKAFETYCGFTFAPIHFQDMEEFLVSQKLKDSIQLQVVGTQFKEFSNIEDRWKIQIEKNTWGFIQGQVRLHGHFLLCDKEWITPEDFIGDTCSLDVRVNKELSYGRYYGAVEIMTRSQSIWLPVEYIASRGRDQLYIAKKYYQNQLSQTMLEALIASYHQQVLSPTWYANAYQVIKTLKHNELLAKEEVQLLELIDIHIRYLRGDFSVAKERLQKIFGQLESGELVETALFKGYYLYLSCKIENSKEYRQEVATILRDLYVEHKEVFVLALFLGEVSDTYQSSALYKLELLKEVFELGCRSPFLYLDIIILLRKYPFSLKKLDSLVIASLEWAFSKGLLTEELIEQLKINAPLIREFNQSAYRLLGSIYHQYKDKEILTALCQLMIRHNFYEEKYFPWYEEGIKEGLNITRLYEYYMATMPENTQLLPKMIRLYFSYQPTLDWSSKALVYKSVVESRLEDPETYEQNVGDILLFVKNALEEGYINEALAWLYNHFLSNMEITPKMAKNLARLWYTYEVQVTSTAFNRLVVSHTCLNRQDNLTIRDKKALVELYSSKDVILLQDEQGRKFPIMKEVQVKRFLDNPFLLGICTSMDVQEDGYLLDLILHQDGSHFDLNYDNIAQSFLLYEKNILSKEAKDRLLVSQLEFLYNHRDDEEIVKYTSLGDYQQMMKVNPRQLIEFLNSRRETKLAYQLIETYGYQGVDYHQLVILLDNLISQSKEKGIYYQKLWLHLALDTFLNKKFTENTLDYLCRFYQGKLSTMIYIWKLSKEFYLEVTELESRIIETLFLTETSLRDYTFILESYLRRGYVDSLVHAWLIRASFEAMRDRVVLSDQMINFLEAEYMRTDDLEDTCRLAFVYALNKKEEITQRQRSILQGWLEDYTKEDIYLGVFEELSAKFHLVGCKEDITSVDIFFDSKAHLVLSYEKFHKDELVDSGTILMNQVIAHLFQGQFVLFYQEKLRWKILVEGKDEVISSGEVQFNKHRIKKSQSKYACINQMFMAYNKKDRSQIEKLIAGYLRYEAFADTQLQKVDFNFIEMEEE